MKKDPDQIFKIHISINLFVKKKSNHEFDINT